MLQESHITFIEKPDIVDAEFLHGHSIQSESECEACVDFRVYTALLKDFRVYHAASKQFNESFPLADLTAFSMTYEAGSIHFSRRLGEWEVVRPELGDDIISVELFDKLFQRSLKIGKGDSFVDDKTLDLIENR